MRSRIAERIGLSFVIACLALFIGTPVRAQQNTADVVGTVTDASGAVIPGATVTITNTGTNISQSQTSSGSGDYTFTLLQVGTYTVKVEAKGFKTYSAPNLALSSGDRARVDAKLEVGDVTQTVEVSGAVAPALQTDTSNLGTLVTTQAVEDVPLNGRNLTKLIQLSAGVSQGLTNSISSGTRPDDRRQTASFSVNGQSDSINNNMVDGMDNNERIIGGNIIRPSVDAIQEVNVSTNLYDASVGRTGGGVVDVITKSGTNNFHGSIYEFFRNRVLNTNPGYSFPSTFTNGVLNHTTVPDKPAFRQNQYGASVGGPIRKDKTFFFADIERLGKAAGTEFQSSVPTACERGSTLVALQAAAQGVPVPSATCTPGLINAGLGDGTTPALPGDFSDINAISALNGGAAGSGAAGVNISTLPMCTAANNSLGGCISKQGLEYFSMFPLANGPGDVNNFSFAGTGLQNSWNMDGRVDQHFSDKDTLFARYSINNVTTYTPNAFPNVLIDTTTGMVAAKGTSDPTQLIVPGAQCCGVQFPGAAKERQQGLGLSYAHVYSPNLVLNLKFAVLRSAIKSLDTNYGTNAANKLGFPCTTTPNPVSPLGSCIDHSNSATGIPSATLTPAAPAAASSATPSYQAFGDASFLPIFEFDTTFNYSGTLTWNKGAHSVKVGVTLIRRRATVGQNNFGNGEFVFDGIYTGVPAADMLEGLAVGGGTGGASAEVNYTLYQPGFRMWEPSTYIQDDWRAKRWLTLNLGLRYDIFTPYTEVHGRSTNYDAATGLIVGASIPGPQQATPTQDIRTPYKDIAPRFGFSMSLPHQLVVRGGFGLSFFPINYQSGYNLKNAPGNFQEICGNQITGGTNVPCPAAYANGQTAHYGNVASNKSSFVNQTGGWAFGAGLPTPFESVNLVFAPSSATCTFSGTTANYGTTCPTFIGNTLNNPYATFGITNIQAFNIGQQYLEQGNLQVQKAFGSNVVTLGGVLEMGRHAPKTLGLNVLSNPTQNVAGGSDPPLAFGFPWLANTTVNQITTTASDMYTGLQATYVRRFSKGLTAQVNYTWSHAITYYGGACTPTNAFNAAGAIVNEPCEYDNVANPSSPFIVPWFNRGANGGPSFSRANNPIDVADRIAGSVNYQLPFGKSSKGFTGALIKGWTTNVAGSWQTGLPFQVGENASGLAGISSPASLPDQTCSGRMANPTLLQWFNSACFHSQTPNTFGNEDGNQLFGPSQRNADFSIFKEFALKENFRMQFRTEVFNLFNTPNFNIPANVTAQFTGCTPTTTTCVGNNNPQTNGQQGEIQALNPNQNSRQIQFALKFLF